MAELEQAILRHDPALVERLNPTSRSAATCPYKGLAPYEGEDADAFFGREAEQSECLRQLGTGRLLVVLGPSGSGKSSLVRAGIVPTLRRAGQRMVLLTPGPRPAEALSAALAGAPRGSGLVVDQLEELFTGRQGTEVARDFLDRLTQFVVSSGPVVVTLRADYVGGLSVSAGFARLMSTGVHLVTAMTEEQVRRAIEEPARHAGLLLEPGLVDVLVRDVLDEPGGLPLLSHALVETWERREGDVLTVDGYRASGGIRGAVAQSAEQLYESLDVEARRRLRAVLLRLVTPSATGDPVGARVPTRVLRGDQTEDLLDLLIRARLVTADSDSATIAHESLATAWPRLRTWLDEDVEGQRVFAHLQVAADGWDSTGRPDSELYRGARLQVAREWRARTGPALAAVEEEFLAASDEREQSERREEHRRLEQQVRHNRRLRRLLAGVAALLVVAIVASVSTLIARDHARTAERQAAREVVQTLATQLDASSLLEPRADTALLLARQAVAMAETPQTRGGLLRALDDSGGLLRSLETVGGATIASELKLSPDGRRLLAYERTGTYLIDTTTGATIPPGRPLVRGTWGPVWMNPAGFVDGGRTAVVTRFTTTGKGPHPVELLAFSTTTGRPVRPPEPIPGAAAATSSRWTGRTSRPTAGTWSPLRTARCASGCGAARAGWVRAPHGSPASLSASVRPSTGWASAPTVVGRCCGSRSRGCRRSTSPRSSAWWWTPRPPGC